MSCTHPCLSYLGTLQPRSLYTRPHSRRSNTFQRRMPCKSRPPYQSFQLWTPQSMSCTCSCLLRSGTLQPHRPCTPPVPITPCWPFSLRRSRTDRQGTSSCTLSGRSDRCSSRRGRAHRLSSDNCSRMCSNSSHRRSMQKRMFPSGSPRIRRPKFQSSGSLESLKQFSENWSTVLPKFRHVLVLETIARFPASVRHLCA